MWVPMVGILFQSYYTGDNMTLIKESDEIYLVLDARRTYKVKVDQNEQGQTIIVAEEGGNIEKFAEEFDELLNQEVELVIDTVQLPQEVDGKTLQIEPAILMALEKFIDV